MKLKNYILTFSFLIVPLFKVFATSQIPDLLIYNGDTLSFFATPLEFLYQNDTLKPSFWGDKETCNSSICRRGYQAEWTIIDNQLYLTAIYSCCFIEDSIKADLTKLFPEKCINKRVKADWVTGNTISFGGRNLYTRYMNYATLNEKAIGFEFDKGRIIETFNYDQKNRELMNYIYSNINWEILPKIDESIKVFVQFSANTNGVIDTLKVVKGDNEIYNNEAIKAISSIPSGRIYFREGVFEIVFNSDYRNKYIK